jgi:hypothetical protein
MKKLFLLLFFWSAILFSQNVDFNKYLVDKTLRIDVSHCGTKTNEYFSIKNIYEYPIWSGNKNRLIDDRNLGEYFLKVYDEKTNILLYSMGYCGVFNEWQTTDEAAKGLFKSVDESLLIPEPKEAVKIVIARRNKKMLFDDIASLKVDPKEPVINKENRNPNFTVNKYMINGDPAKKVDLVIMGDGYAKEDISKFRKDIDRFVKTLFDVSPFKERKNDFNVYAIEVVSNESGIDNPRKNIWKNTPIGTSYNSLNSQRYILTEENKTLRDIAGMVPYDCMIILVNSSEYGGGGIFNLYSTCYTIPTSPELNWQCDYVFVHEFGHSFGGLGDEYYTSDVPYNEMYPEGVEPWEPNISRILDKNNLKWGNMIEKGVPVPTPWGKEEYDSLSASMRKLDRTASDYFNKRKEIADKQKEIMTTQKYDKKVGYFEGSGYGSKDLYRPFIDCRMFSLSLTGFDPVCKKAIENTIDFYTK